MLGEENSMNWGFFMISYFEFFLILNDLFFNIE